MVLAIVFILVLVFVIGICVLIFTQASLFDGKGGHPMKYFECFANQVSSRMLSSGMDEYKIRRFAGALAAYDPYEWVHTPKAPVTVVNPVGEGWKKNLNMHLSSISLSMLDEFLTFQGGVFFFNKANFDGELYILPIEVESLPSVEFSIDTHRELFEIGLKWFAPATLMSMIVPVGRAVVVSLRNDVELVLKEGLNESVNITAPIVKIEVKKIN